MKAFPGSGATYVERLRAPRSAAASYVLGIGGAVLVVGTLFGLRRVSGVLQRWGVSREEFVLATVPGFDVKRVVELVRSERVDLRGLEHLQDDDGDRIVILVKLRPLYRPEQLLDALKGVEGVLQVEWEQ